MIFKFRIQIGTFLRLNVIFCHLRFFMTSVTYDGEPFTTIVICLVVFERRVVQLLSGITHYNEDLWLDPWLVPPTWARMLFYSCRVRANHLETLSKGIAIPFALDNKYLFEFDSKLHNRIEPMAVVI